MAVFVQDAFTGSDGTLLSAHTPDVGGTWTRYFSTAGSDAAISTNRLRPTGGENLNYYNTATPSDADYDVQAVCQVLSVPANYAWAICGRMSTVAETMYVLQADDRGVVVLLYINAGGETELDSDVWTPTVGSFTFKLEMRGTAIKGYRNGIEILSATSGAISAAGKAGLRKYWDTTSSTGLHWDSYVATDLSSGVPPVRRSIGLPRPVVYT